MPKYSIIIPYRDRLEHIKIVVPRLRQVFKDEDFEIIISEQADQNIFRRGNTRNVGFQHSLGEIVVFHDADYFPVDVKYWDGASDLFLPVYRVKFVRNDMSDRPENDIPGGYTHFKNGVDDDFFGGALTFKREIFERINGFSPLFKGWGHEDVDLRNRVQMYGVDYRRSKTGFFFALDHKDSGPAANDQNHHNNINLAQHSRGYLNEGLRSAHQPDIKVVSSKLEGVDVWVESTNYDPPSHIVASSFNFDEGDE